MLIEGAAILDAAGKEATFLRCDRVRGEEERRRKIERVKSKGDDERG